MMVEIGSTTKKYYMLETSWLMECQFGTAIRKLTFFGTVEKSMSSMMMKG